MDISMGVWIACFAIGVLTLLLIGIGVKQILSTEPIAFYTGDEPPEKNMLKSVRAWNTGHGILWISCGVVLVTLALVALFAVEDNLVRTALLFAGGLLPMFILMIGHSILMKKLYL